MLESNEEWKKIGGRLILPVHDELICEVPAKYWKEGGELLSKIMCDAADFLPFPSKCDVTTTLRWYGEEYPCKYPKPSDTYTDDPEEIKWIQYHLVESEYILPTYKNEDGSKPIGDAAHGINGVKSDEYLGFIADYIKKRGITESQFLDTIEREVFLGHV